MRRGILCFKLIFAFPVPGKKHVKLASLSNPPQKSMATANGKSTSLSPAQPLSSVQLCACGFADVAIGDSPLKIDYLFVCLKGQEHFDK